MEDLKIGAVFSLADSDCVETDQNSKANDGTLCDPTDLLPDADDTDEVDIMPGAALRDLSKSKTNVMPVLASHLVDNSSHIDSDHGLMDTTSELNESTDSVPSPRLSDLDAPPSLQLEGVTGRTMSPCSSNYEDPIPPILLREFSPIDQENDIVMESPKKKIKLNQTILPSYIVLSKVDRFVPLNKKVSYREFKHLQTECSNMCKKTLFKRRLNAGQDVFNVKTPSKQKDYQIYLQQYEEEREKSIIVRKRRQAKARTLTTFTDMLKIHDRNIKNRTKSTNRKYFSRVRRNISHIPTDFKVVHTPDEREGQRQNENETVNDRDEIEHKRQLDSLKRLIMIKRRMNFKLKQLKLQEAKSQSPFDISGTKSFSGRVRKTNNRYKGDFASSKMEVERFAIIHDTKKMLEQEKKKLKQSTVKKDRRPQLIAPSITRRHFVIDIENDADANKVAGTSSDIGKQEIDISSAQKEDQPCVARLEKTKSGKERLKRKLKRTSNLLAKNKGIDPTDFVKETELHINQTRRELAEKKTKDGVLIQDMPNEANVLSKILQTMNVPIARRDRAATLDELSAEAKDIDNRFKFTRELLEGKSSPHVPEKEVLCAVKVKQEPIDPLYETAAQIKPPTLTGVSKETLDKYKMLRIPENVQKLFLKSNSTQSAQPKDGSLSAAYAQTSHTVVGAPHVKVLMPVSNIVSSTGVSSMHQPPRVVKIPCGTVSNSPGTKTLPKFFEAVTPKIILNSKSLLRPAVSSPKSSIQTQTSGTQGRILSRNIVNAIRTSNPAISPNTSSTSKITTTANTNNSSVTRPLVPSTIAGNLRPVCPSSPIVLSQKVGNQSVPGGIMPVLLTNQIPGLAPQHQIVPTAVPTSLPIQAMSIQTQVRPVNALQYASTGVQHLAQPVTQPVQQTARPAGKMSFYSVPLNTVPSTTQSFGVATENKLDTQMLTKGKFYLLKVDGKNILIPTDNLNSQTKAFVINATISNTLQNHLSTGQVKSQMATLSSNTVLSSSTTQMKLSSKPPAKPTATVGPNFQRRPMASTTAALVGLPSASSMQASDAGKFISITINQSLPSSKATASSNVPVVKSDDKGTQKTSQFQAWKPATQMSVSDLLVAKRNRIVEDLKRKCATEMATLNAQKETAEKYKQKETETSTDEPNKNLPAENFHDSDEEETLDHSSKLPYDNGDTSHTNDEAGCQLADTTPLISAQEQVTSGVGETKPVAFSEAVSAREERLRRLKELLKQKQEAVEAIRLGKT